MQTPHESHAVAALALGFLEQLSDFWKLVLVAGAIFTAGGGVALAAVNFRGLPARVNKLERLMIENDSLHIDLNARLSLVETDARRDRVRIEAKIDRLICFNEAERGERSYEACIE